MCFYIVQEATCSKVLCDKTWYIKVYRTLCEEPQEHDFWASFCDSSSTWLWIQRAWQTDGGILPLSCCPDCLNRLAPPSPSGPSCVQVQSSGCPCQMPTGLCICEMDTAPVTIPWNQVLADDLFGEDLAVFAKHRLAYQQACFTGAPQTTSIVCQFVSDREVEVEVERIMKSYLEGNRLDGMDEETEKQIVTRRTIKEKRERKRKWVERKAAKERARAPETIKPVSD